MTPSRSTPRPFGGPGRTRSGTLAASPLEWEDMPSLVDRVRHAARHARDEAQPSGWDSTRPAGLDELPGPHDSMALEAEPFVQPVAGLEVREVRGHHLFQHFFGPGRTR